MSGIAVGIVGCGKIARDQHLPAIAAIDGLHTVAIADPAASVESMPSYPTIAAMLAAHPEIAALSLCMPPQHRAEAAREAIAAGRHVLLEKPPSATVAEAEEIERLARDAGVTLFTAWHSQEGAAVRRARDALAGRSIHSVRVTWKEDVRVWHPGQKWIWRKGGFGVFDPGINALSILTCILPGDLRLERSRLEVPANAAVPIAAWLSLKGESDLPVAAEFDFRQTGPQCWDIDIATDRGRLKLTHGGNRLDLDGVPQPVGNKSEYAALYARFSSLIGSGESDVHLAPLRLVEGALATDEVVQVEPFED